MDNKNPNQLPALPEPPPGRNYTRMCIAVLRRQAQKIPTLSGVADHLEVMDEELRRWETRAREIFAIAQQLQDTVEGLKEELDTKGSQIEALFDDFAQERDLCDSTQQQAQSQLSHFQAQLSRLTQDLTQANEQLAGYSILDREQKAQIQELSSQLSSLRGLYESVVRDLDSTQARMEAQLLSQSQIIQQLQDKLIEAQRQHENDLGVSLDVIAQLREDLASAHGQLQALLDQKQAWEKQRADLTCHTGEPEDRILSLIQDKESLQRELNNANAQIQQHRNDLDEANTRLAQSQQLITDLSSRLEQTTHRSNELSARVSGLESDLDEAIALAVELEEQADATAQQLSELRVKYQQAIEQMEMFQSQQHTLDLAKRLSEANATIEQLNRQLAQARLQLIPQPEENSSRAEDLLQRQPQDPADLEVVPLGKGAQSSQHDESVPWDVRAWQGSAEQAYFVPVPGVKQWLDKNGLTLEDLTAENFPGFTSADREHLAMCAGINVQQFCQLPYVRPWLANRILAQLKSGVSPIAMEGQWQVLPDGHGNPSVRWRVNKLWQHLVATTGVDVPQSWEIYLLAHEVGAPQPAPPPLQAA